MLFDALNGGTEGIVQILLMLPIILFSLSLHEAAHAYVAMKLGDNTANFQGRVTLNPLRHLDPLGFLSMLLIGIGWANPVAINVRNFKNPRKGMMLSSLAGPLSNFLLAILMTVCEAFAFALYLQNQTSFLLVLYLFFYLASTVNFSLAIFNLIPCPPFDGSRIFFYFLPKNWYFRVMQYERYIGMGILVFVLLLGRLGYSPLPLIVGKLSGLLLEPLIPFFLKLLA